MHVQAYVYVATSRFTSCVVCRPTKEANRLGKRSHLRRGEQEGTGSVLRLPEAMGSLGGGVSKGEGYRRQLGEPGRALGNTKKYFEV